MERETIDLSGPLENRQEKVTSYLHHEMKEATIEEILVGLMHGSGTMETIACLDMILQKQGKRVVLFSDKKGREYPYPNVGIPPSIDPPMKPVDHVYKGGFFKSRHKLSWRAEIIGEALVSLCNLTTNSSVVDVGCAIGDYVKWFNDAGITAWGIEGSEAAREFVVTTQYSIRDLREKLKSSQIHEQYNLVISLEVAEHIEPEFAGIYLDNLCLLSDTILMTAAHPGQGGHGHVNCQEKEWWTEKMKDRGYGRDCNMERRWQELLRPWNHRKEVAVYSKNILIFKKYHLGG